MESLHFQICDQHKKRARPDWSGPPPLRKQISAYFFSVASKESRTVTSFPIVPGP